MPKTSSRWSLYPTMDPMHCQLSLSNFGHLLLQAVQFVFSTEKKRKSLESGRRSPRLAKRSTRDIVMCTGVFQKASILFFHMPAKWRGIPKVQGSRWTRGSQPQTMSHGAPHSIGFHVRTRTPDVSPGWGWGWGGLAGFKSRRSISARMLSSMTLFSQNALPRFAPICVCLFPSNRRSSCCCFRLVGRVGLVSCPPVKGLQTAPSSSFCHMSW